MTTSSRLVIYGSGGHSKVIADAAAQSWDVLGFADDDESLLGKTITSNTKVIAIGHDALVSYCQQHNASAVVAVGANRTRKRLFEALLADGVDLATIVHPSAVVAPTAQLGIGTVVFAGAIVNPHARIGRNVILNTGVTVDHDNWLGDHVHLSPGTHTGGTVKIGDGSHLGVGVSVRNDTQIGAWSLVGVGAAVVEDIPDAVVAYGVPARPIRPHRP